MLLTPRCLRPVLSLSLALLLSGALPGCKKEAEPSDEGGPREAPVKWEGPERHTLKEWTELLGTTQPLPGQVARVSAAVGGPVLSLLKDEKGKPVAEGQEVSKGQVLARLDDFQVRASRDKALASRGELEALAEQAGFAVQLAQITLTSVEKLHVSSGRSAAGLPNVSQVELEKAKVALDQARAQQKAAKAKLDAIQSELKTLEEEAALYTLRAPIAGRLGLVNPVQGQALAVGTTVAEIVNLDEIDVLCFVPARTAALLQLKQEARLEGEAEGGEAGHVVFIGVQAQPETGTVGVKVRLPNKKRGLRANTLQRVQVLTNSKKDCLTIPESALMEDTDPPTVNIVETAKRKNKEGKEEALKKKNKEGKEEDMFQSKKVLAEVGLRGTIVEHGKEEHCVEILGLKDPETKKDVPLTEKTIFVVEGGNGLESGDLIKKEEEHKPEEPKEGEKKDEPKKDESK
ncbi:MAG TPA: efflux RND transporter periplasmic adaptor subunit [Gemmataceae bacterium]|nr:efflux RND transporter periplasmic adaptor subunit [Gemmataceae bacterium]